MATNAAWGGRFTEQMNADIIAFNQSVSFDRILADYDIAGSIAHATMLGETGLIPNGDAKQIIAGLKDILDTIHAGEFSWDPDLEDVHMNIESALKTRIGAVAGKLHTARSRNDQIALDMRLWMRSTIDSLIKKIRSVMRALANKSLEYHDAVMPGYTHMQRAMPVTAGHHLLAYVNMLDRDAQRLADCRKRVNVLPLGSAALAGTGLPINRERVAELLDFDGVMANSMDGVSARDHFIEFAADLATLAVTLSRFAEDAIFWHSMEAGFASVSEAFCTGSSIMPQKKNPDIFELIRGKSAAISTAVFQLIVLVKAQPMAYNKDLQEDKPVLFKAAADAGDSLNVLAPMIESLTFHRDTMRVACEGGFMDAISLADYLVRKGAPFRDAHRVAGELVKLAEDKHLALMDLTDDDYASAHPDLTPDVRECLGASGMVSMYQSLGSANPDKVREQASRWLKVL